jgi:uncharacterized protein YegL
MKKTAGVVAWPGAALLALCVLWSPAATEEVREFSVAGGMVMRGWPENDSTMPCILHLQTPSRVNQRRLPVQIVALIDASRDMQGEAVRYARESARLIVDKLHEGDLFSVVTFSEHATLVSPMQPINDRNRQAMRAAISGFHEGAGRNLSAGIEKAVEQFARFSGQDAAARFVFCITNGDPDVGAAEPGPLRARASRLLDQSKASMSVFGVEEEFSEEVMLALARENGGRYYFAEEPKLLVSQVDLELQRAAFPAAQDIVLDIETPSASSLAAAYGGAIEGEKIRVGDMAAGERRIVYFILQGRPNRQRDCVVNVTYVESDGLSRESERLYIPIALTSGATQFDPMHAPRYMVSSVLHMLAEKSAAVETDRRGYTNFFRMLVDELDQENVTLNSAYIRDSFDYFAKLDKTLMNTAIENRRVVKAIKFKAIESMRRGL